VNPPGAMTVRQEGALPSGQASVPGASHNFIIGPDDRILVTGAAGFIGSRVVDNLLERGFRNLVCFARPSSELQRIEAITDQWKHKARIAVLKGNLLSRQDCETACKEVALVYHLAAGTGEKSFPDAFLNSVVTTRNLLDAARLSADLRRFVHISSFAVYSNCQKPQRGVLDESCPVDEQIQLRGEAYAFAKLKQERILAEYGKRFGLPYVVLRPGSVYGGDKAEITGRIGIGTFGLFLHMGGANTIPFTYVDNCAEAIVLAGLVKGVDGETFNVVDDDLPTSRQYLRWYKRNIRSFKSLYVPHAVSHVLCFLWEKYSNWSKGQLPPAFNRRRWHAYWKKTRYSNQKLKALLGWSPRVPTEESMQRHFRACRRNLQHA